MFATMTKTISVVATVVGVLTACSDDAVTGAGPSGCPDITGNYSVTSTRESGTCDPKLDQPTSTIAFQKGGEGQWLAMIPGIQGGCPGAMDAACKFTAACEFKDAAGATIGTANASYAFTNKGYTGSTASGLRPPAVPSTCQVTYRETGTKL